MKITLSDEMSRQRGHSLELAMEGILAAAAAWEQSGAIDSIRRPENNARLH